MISRSFLKVRSFVVNALLFLVAGVMAPSPGLCELCRQKEQFPFEETCNYFVDGAKFEATNPFPMRESGPFEDVVFSKSHLLKNSINRGNI